MADLDDKVFDKINDVDLKNTMEQSYIEYAMSVIASRALPDVRDGLKPVQRRVLYSMIELNNGPDKPHRKSARIVGDTMGKYHPHGDSSIYGALVNMAQDWSTRYPLVDGHGNFGSVDGDGAAAMRYTEARLSHISMEMLRDINKDTVDFMPNFDETEKEPTVLPARFPNLLVNGTTGIAVGMATNIPPHNLREAIGAVVKIIDNRVNEDRDTDIDELLQIVKGPDFPTGGMILGTAGIEQAYRTGKGKIRVRAVTDIEPMDNGKNRIVVTELPFLVNKARLIEKIADLVKEKRISGITDLRDESDRQGMRVVIELRRDANPNVILNQLFKHTQLQDTFGVNMLALVNNEPKVLNLSQLLHYYLDHQKDVVTRRTKYELNKAQERAHILEGLLIALDNIDEVISIIRSSQTTNEAKERLTERFGLSDRQSQAIVDMRLRALTGLEREKIENEYKELEATIARLKEILGDEKVLLGVIRKEIMEISDKYGDDRRTSIGFDAYDIDAEDMIPNEDVIIALTNLGYIKRMDPDQFRVQNRGGRGIKGMATIEDDFIKDLFMTTTHNELLFFTNTGRVYRMKTYQIPEGSRTSRGTAIINLLHLMPNEKIAAVLPMEKSEHEQYIVMATKNGVIKRSPLSAYAHIRSIGITAIVLREGDALIGVKLTDGNDTLSLVTENGMCIHFHETDAPAKGRVSMGVKGMGLTKGDVVISMTADSEGENILFVSEKGLGKCTPASEFKIQNRGGKGLHCYKIVEKTGKLSSAMSVNPDDEILIITSEGILIRMAVADISVLGRSTSGVKLVNMEDGVTVASVAKVQEKFPSADDPQESPQEDVLQPEEAAVTEDAEEDSSESITESGENPDE